MQSVFVPPAPSGQVQNLSIEQEGLNVDLSWKNVLEQEQQGFIKGYIVSYSRVDGETLNSFGKWELLTFTFNVKNKFLRDICIDNKLIFALFFVVLCRVQK